MTPFQPPNSLPFFPFSETWRGRPLLVLLPLEEKISLPSVFTRTGRLRAFFFFVVTTLGFLPGYISSVDRDGLPHSVNLLFPFPVNGAQDDGSPSPGFMTFLFYPFFGWRSVAFVCFSRLSQGGPSRGSFSLSSWKGWQSL